MCRCAIQCAPTSGFITNVINRILILPTLIFESVLSISMNTAKNYLIANEGMSSIYIIPAVIGFALSIPFFFFLWPVAFVLVPLSVMLLTIKTGFEYNLASNEYRSFKSLFGAKWGEWTTAAQPSSFDLRLSVEREYSNNPFSGMGAPGGFYGNSKEIARSVTYDLSYSNNRNQREIMFEFLDYDLAKKFIRELHEHGTIPVTNHIALKLQENQKKRMQRMR